MTSTKRLMNIFRDVSRNIAKVVVKDVVVIILRVVVRIIVRDVPVIIHVLRPEKVITGKQSKLHKMKVNNIE